MLKPRKWPVAKANQIGLRMGLLVLAVLFTTCSLNACSIPSASVGADGKAFVEQKLKSLKPNWDTTDFDSGLDPRIDKKLVAKAFEQYVATLGTIQEIGDIQAGESKVSVGIGVPDYIGEYNTTLTCQKGKAKVAVLVEHSGGKWHIQNFNLNSDLFKNLGKEDSKGALIFVQHFVRRWVDSGFKSEMLRANADPTFAKELNKTEVPIELLCTTMKKMGKLRKLSKPELQQILPAADGFAFAIITRGDSKNMHADILLQVVKDDGKWKVHNFQMQSKSHL